jgi:5-methylcytosine-specific restriction protein B
MSKTTNELGGILRDMYTNAIKGEQVMMIHIFGIKYAEEIKKVGIKEVLVDSGIHSSYRTELNKGVKLSKYVRPK